MKFLHLTILTFALISNSTFAKIEKEEIIMRCEKGLGEYTPWYKYKKRHYPVKNLTFEYSYIWRKNKETGKWEWRSNPCEEYRIDPMPLQKSEYGRKLSFSEYDEKLENKILTCKTRYFDHQNRDGGTKSTQIDFEKLTFNDHFHRDHPCETLEQHNGNETKEKERIEKLDKDRTYVGVIMGSKYVDIPLIVKEKMRFNSDNSFSYRYEGLVVEVFFYNENLRLNDNFVSMNKATIQLITVRKFFIDKEKVAIILKNMDSKYQLLRSTSRSKTYFNKGDGIYVEWSEYDNNEFPNKYFEFKIQYKSKELVKVSEEAAKLEAEREADRKAEIAREKAKFKEKASGF